MKKMFLGVIVAGLMITGASALEGKVTSIVVNSSVVKVGITPTGSSEIKKNVDASSALGKALIAAAITAKESQKPVAAFHDGVSWNYFEYKE